MNAIMYSAMVDGCWPLRLNAVLVKANATMPNANSEHPQLGATCGLP